jgi:hypothetical protein
MEQIVGKSGKCKEKKENPLWPQGKCTPLSGTVQSNGSQSVNPRHLLAIWACLKIAYPQAVEKNSWWPITPHVLLVTPHVQLTHIFISIIYYTHLVPFCSEMGKWWQMNVHPPKKNIVYIYIIGVDSYGSFRYHWNHPILSLLKTVVFHDAVCYVAELQSFPNLHEPENSWIRPFIHDSLYKSPSVTSRREAIIVHPNREHPQLYHHYMYIYIIHSYHFLSLLLSILCHIKIYQTI